ncbi:hypothetical protein PGTUg99_010376 [Puccinia graminis f. sp. tritici]|uniref:Uncharacterized protein n=1 Tax=Puccinia graminis f. sp. tritici TaxID=56615 RepID=A0A5B0SDM3_PUCGR|nr:hypothetical protein PGTUg99_010376 [Puccinia graminis f. sp. tritici]
MTKQKHLTLAQSIDPSAIRYLVDNPRLVALILHIAILLLLRLTAQFLTNILPPIRRQTSSYLVIVANDLPPPLIADGITDACSPSVYICYSQQPILYLDPDCSFLSVLLSNNYDLATQFHDPIYSQRLSINDLLPSPFATVR